jgi:capsular exopolysaccharide synthesis family protein
MKSHQTQRSERVASSERSFQEYLAIVLRGKWVIIICFLLVVAATVVFTLMSDRVYQATCQIILSRETKGGLFADQVQGEANKTAVQNELAVLNSRSLADSVAGRLLRQRYLDPNKPAVIPIIAPDQKSSPSDTALTLDEVSGTVMGAVDFDPVRDSDIIKITARSKNAKEAALLANTYAETYRDRNIYMSRAKTRSFREFLESQARDKRKSLEETEGSLKDYMEQQGIVSLDDESKRMIDQLASLEAQRDASDINIKEYQNSLENYQQQLPQQETNVARVVGEASDTYIRQMQEQLARLEVQRDMTVVQNPSSAGRDILNERVKEIDQQIQALRMKLQRRTDDFLRTLTPSQGGAEDAASYLKSVKQKIIETEIAVQSQQAKKRALNEAIAEYERKFDRIPQKSIQLARLQRQRASNEKLFTMVEEKFNETNITEQSNLGYIEILERAGVPSRPSSPKPLINLMIGVILGLTIGLVAAFVKEYTGVRVQTPEDIKRRGYAPLTPIMNIDSEINKLGGQKMSAKAKAVDTHLVTASFPFSSIAESYRQMRTNLQFAKVGTPMRTLLLTSATAGEGKSTTAANLSVAFAQTGKKTLLVDADLRQPALHTMFKLDPGVGLTEYLTGKAPLKDIVRKTSVENLDLVPSGDIPPNPAEVLGSDEMREFVTAMLKTYEMVLFDTSPVLAVTDPAVISTMIDGSVIVVSAGSTRMQDLDQAVELIEGVGGKVAGVVLNNFDPHHAYGVPFRRATRGKYGYGQGEYGSRRKQEDQEKTIAGGDGRTGVQA